MINLLPEENKNRIKAEYRARLIFVSLALFFVVVIVAIVFQALLYVSIAGMERTLLNKMDFYTDNFFGDESELNSEIRSINKKLGILGQTEGARSVHGDIISVIIDNREGVNITGLSYDKNKMGAQKVRVSGNSPNRKSIVNFVESLNMEGFAEVNSPVSNFVKNKDIEFSIEITL